MELYKGLSTASMSASISTKVPMSNLNLSDKPPILRMERHFNEKSIVHMFLPKRTPDKGEDDLQEIEEDILTFVADSFQEMMESINFSQLAPVRLMLDKWVHVQPKSSLDQNPVEAIKTALEGLKVGDTVPIYIRQQNCTLMISKFAVDDGEEKVRVQAFRPSLPCETVMSNVDSLKMDFPETSNIIENESLLCSSVFASQICEMAMEAFEVSTVELGNNYNKITEVANPFLVSDWTVGVLVPREDPTCHLVSKKIRDQITASRESSGQFTPFRRSGMWMSIKVAIQLKMLEVVEGDQDTAKLVYKLTMLRISVDACRSYEKHKNPFDLDLACQMVAKVGRRVQKIHGMNCGKCEDAISFNVKLMRSTVLEYTVEVLTTFNERIQKLWKQIASTSETGKLQPIFRSNEEFRKDLVHEMSPLDEFVTKARQMLENSSSLGGLDMETMIRNSRSSLERLKKHRFPTMDSIVNSTNISRDWNQLWIWLHDTAQFIKGIKDEREFTSEQIFNLGKRFITEAKNAYHDNPVGFSQMMLVCLKLYSILDKIAGRNHPMVLQYKPDIKASSFDCLLLPHEHDVDLLNELLDYFSFRDKKCSRSILERVVDQNTLSVRYAQQNYDMMKLKARIQHDTMEAIKRKIAEVERVREECLELERRMKAVGGSCSCRYETRVETYWCQYTKANCTRNYQVKVYSCEYCPLKSELDRKRVSVSTYEVPLPPPPHLQNAVVFEYLIPEDLSYLRQFLTILKYEILGEPPLEIYDSRCHCHWLDYCGLCVYKSNVTTNMITLGSTVKPASPTKPDVLLKSNESFIVNNRMNSYFFYVQWCRPVQDFQGKCTFSLTTTANSEPYRSLQKYFSSYTTHSQNDVLTNQSDCHQKLTLNEFVAFGSLRAGHRIQLRNLYVAISSRSLALEKEPVLALILQTIWQVGPRGQNGRREAHLDFQLDEFSFEFLEMLEKLVQSNESNYSSPLILLTAIFITARITELNENCRNKCLQLFKQWRKLTKTWCSKIENDLIANDLPLSTAKKATMQKILHEIRMCSMMTFLACCPHQMSNVCKDDEDLAYLFYTLNTKNLLTRESNPTFSGFMNILRFMEQLIPVRLQLETQAATEKGYGGFSRFMQEKLSPAPQYTEHQITRIFDSNIIIVQYSNDYCIAMDVFTGELLINGYPEMELSSQFHGNIEFRRFFQKYLNFRLRRMSSTVLRTMDDFHGKHYEFRTHAVLEILEIQKDKDSCLVIVPHQIFRGFLNDYFIDNYTHWLDPKKGFIYFRRIAISENEYDLAPEFNLMKQQASLSEGWLFHDEINQQFLMNIHSDSFALLSSALSRLELAKYIHVYLDHEKNVVVGAHLPRHNLRFTLQSNGLLESMEYPGFQLSLDPNCVGTFVGLNSGVLLENGAKRNFIVPHGKIKVSMEENDLHQLSKIDLSSLSQPSFYIYEVDDVLKRIVAKKSISSWLYLAALHAVTSSSQPDPFTGMTGTEMAVYILQSAIVWSCSPYDMESLEILKFIKELIPKRNYYGHGTQNNQGWKEEMETVEWPLGIPTMIAFEGYPYLVKYLIQDSLRLRSLHPVQDNCSQLYAEIMETEFSEKLHWRAYTRNLSKYNDQVRVKDEVVKRLVPEFTKNECQLYLRATKPGFELAQMVTTAYIRHISGNSLPLALNNIPMRTDALTPFLFTTSALYTDTKGTIALTLKSLLDLEFRSRWLRYYSMAISETVDNLEFSIVLSALAYRGAPLEQIWILHFIRTLVEWEVGNFPSVPDLPINCLHDPSHNFYSASEITEVLKKHSEPYPKIGIYPSDGFLWTWYKFCEERHNAKVAANCKSIAERWEHDYWPCSEINSENEVVQTPDGKRIIRNDEIEMGLLGNIASIALEEVNAMVMQWHCARELKFFMDEVQEKITAWYNKSVQGLQQFDFPVLQTISTNVKCQKIEIRLIELADFMDRNEIFCELHSQASGIYRTGRYETQESKQTCEHKIWEINDRFLQNILKTANSRILYDSGLIPRLSPVSLLRSFQDTFVGLPTFNQLVLQKYVGALCVLWTNLKRLSRCLHFQLHGQQAELQRELSNLGHENWSPKDYPQWLLIELELDIMIRKVQIEVAQQMMSMPDGKNGVMQLNMGEGKTSVIVPMLCSILAKEDSLCRVTVLSSIFKMNWNILKFTIGGLLNQRLYSFPCRRDMQISEPCVSNIQTIYKECMKMKGVVLTLPEYRLSFRLLAYDNLLKGKNELGLKLLQTEDWLRWHARDILDESDELLSVKYQLIYTIGEQVQVDGGEVRWNVCQQILDFVQDIATGLLETHGSTLIEFDGDWKVNYPHEFAVVRLVATKENEKFFNNFERLVAEKYLSEITLPESQMKEVKNFLFMKGISPESHENLISILKRDPALLDKILTLAGYIHRGILSLALSKRWRVEYGVDPKGFRRMAVPFRAKDVAAERTEFGHPDLAIILTHLSYYYSGLSDSELEEVFTILAMKISSGAIYSEWIQQIPEELVPPSLTAFHCLNLKDAFQKSKLFDLIRKHKMVVDFWLSHAVFPKESKQFPAKLVMTAADLVYERQRLPITGFSGTNDSIVLLPQTISQQDLPQLQETNKRMEQVLLQPENNGHRQLAMGATCKNILQLMKVDNLRILIDSGALMLDLHNEQVAQRWLEIDPRIEAVVYFNKENDLMVKSRGAAGGRKAPDVPLDFSPFQGRLELCGVFLDDQHTRGTDLKFPVGSKACVTIGSRMKREKLMQACMRMRKLGNGHSVAFFLSNEASNKVMDIGRKLSTSAVIKWVKLNTKKFNDDGLLHWAIAAKNYAQRLAAEDIYHFPNWKDPINTKTHDAAKAIILANQCEDKEVTALMDMYGQHSRFELLIDLVFTWFKSSKDKLEELNKCNPLPQEVKSRFDEIRRAVWDRCCKYVPDKRLLSSSIMVDEEQEKELELEKEAEVEEERQVERPGKLDPAIPSLHPNVVRIVVHGEPFRVMPGILRLSDIFKDTTFAGEVQPDDWAVEIYATNDFISVIHSKYVGSSYYNTDSYSRPMEYFVSRKGPNGTIQILFLSPHELNELMPHIRNHETKCPLHMFTKRKFERQNMLLNMPRLQLPPAVIDPSTEKFRVLKSGTREMAALLLASGSLYFNNPHEQEAFALFLCLEAKPWDAKRRQLFESGMITTSGFLVPEFRRGQNVNPLGFQRDPMGLVKRILMCRHPVVNDVSHVVRLLEEKTYIKFRKREN